MLTSARSSLRRADIGTRLATSLIIVGLAAVALALLVTGPLAPVLSRDLDGPGSSFFFAQAPFGASVFRRVGALGDPAVAGSIVIALCTIVGVRATRVDTVGRRRGRTPGRDRDHHRRSPGDITVERLRPHRWLSFRTRDGRGERVRNPRLARCGQ